MWLLFVVPAKLKKTTSHLAKKVTSVMMIQVRIVQEFSRNKTSLLSSWLDIPGQVFFFSNTQLKDNIVAFLCQLQKAIHFVMPSVLEDSVFGHCDKSSSTN